MNSESKRQLPENSDGPTLSKRAKMVSVALLCFVNVINYMDRYTVSSILGDIEDYFHIGHQEGGLLQTAFIICYFASAPIFGFLGDRYSRKNLMIVGVFTWGTCTAISSFMDSYWSFLIFRAAIGFGESGFTSLAPTVLGDLYDGQSRTICLALFYYAIPVGSGLGYIVGSTFANLAGDWRWGVRVTPFLNLVALILMALFLVDPPRGEAELHGGHLPPNTASTSQSKKEIIKAQMHSWGKDLKYLLKNRSYVLSTLAFTCLTFCVGALSWWGPYFIENVIKLREEQNMSMDIGVDDVSFIFGVVMCIAGVVGLTLGSGLSYFLRRRLPWIDPVICGVGLLISAPFIFSALGTAVSNGVVGAFVLMFLGQVFLNMNWAIVVDISLYVVIPNRRASAEAFQLMASHALGEAGSPYLSGLIADQIKMGLENATSTFNSSALMSEAEVEFHAFQTSLYSSMGFELLSGLFFLWTTAYILSDKAKADEEEQRLAELCNGDEAAPPYNTLTTSSMSSLPQH